MENKKFKWNSLLYISFGLLCNVDPSQAWAVNDIGCRTPDRGTGNCIVAKDCKSFTDFLLAAPKPIPSYIQNKLVDYQCGFEQKEIKVCCPDGPIPIQIKNGNQKSEKQNNLQQRQKKSNLLPEECGYVDLADKISHGKDAALGEFPWMALLSYKKNSGGSQFRCGGTVINDRYILTAAHCLVNLKTPLVGVRVGEHDLSTTIDCEIQNNGQRKCLPPVQDVIVEKIISHPGFTTDFTNKDGFNDIGLVRVSQMNLTAANVQPICLPLGDTVNAKQSFISIIGWGYTEKETTISNKLQKASLPVISQKECQTAFKTVTVSEKQLCANGRKKNTCSGDSGGPLQAQSFINDDVRAVQFGVISFGGAVCGAGTFPGIYTRVSSYVDWILDNIEP